MSLAPFDIASLICSRIIFAAESFTTGPRVVSFFNGSSKIYFSVKFLIPSTKSL